MKRILIVKMWALGDILMATPLLRAIKQAAPGCTISWLAEKSHAGILEHNPLIDEVIAFDSGTWRRHFRYGRLLPYWRMSRHLQRDLRDHGFDVVINLTAEKWWSWWFSVAPVRIGLFPREKPGLVSRLYTHPIPRTDTVSAHNTRHYLRPAGALDIPGPYDERMVLAVSPVHRRAVQDFLAEQSVYDPNKPLVVLHPGASQDSKCWPPSAFASVAAALAGRFNIVVTGSPQERPLADALLAALPAGAAPPVVAVGRLPHIGQTVALVSQAAAVVTGDTSVLHIASALETPLVGVYGSTRPGDNAPLFGPNVLLYDDSVPCAPCYKADCPLKGDDFMRCQRAVTPAQVLMALETLLARDVPSPVSATEHSGIIAS